MIIFKSSLDKANAIDVLEIVIKQYMYHGLSTEAFRNIRNHLDWMRNQTGELNVSCRMETFPLTQTTEFHISASFIKPPTQN